MWKFLDKYLYLIVATMHLFNFITWTTRSEWILAGIFGVTTITFTVAYFASKRG